MPLVCVPVAALQLERCSACSDINGATGLNRTTTSSDVGSTLRFEVTASNVFGDSTTATSAQTAVVVGRPREAP